MKMMEPPPPDHHRHGGQPPVIYYMQPGAQPLEDDDEIDLRRLWQHLKAGKWWILALTLLAASAAAFFAWTAEPRYEVSVVMSPVESGKGGGLSALASQFGGLASLAGIDLGGGGGKTEEALAVLESRRFTEAFIRDHQLLPVLFADRWDAEQGRWRLEAGEKAPDMWDAVKVFNEIRQVNSDKKSGLVTLTLRWRNPQQAAQWANELVERINRHMQAQAVQEAQESIDYLREQLKNTDLVEMEQAIYRLIEAQTKNIMFAKVRDEYVFRVIDPAIPPDVDEPVSPKRGLIVTLGVVVGLILGVFVALLRGSFSNETEEAAEA